MPNLVITSSLLLATLLLVLVAQALAQIVCQNNGCDNTDSCCTSSRSCAEEHSLVTERSMCQKRRASLTQEIPGRLQYCRFDFETLSFESCPNSYSSDVSLTVGDYGKPNWVGAEFQSVNYEQFSMNVSWEHKDAEKIQFQHINLSPVRGYEIRIYQKYRHDFETGEGGELTLRECLCATDASMRNVSWIQSPTFKYSSTDSTTSHLIVEVRSYPSLVGNDERNSRRNCSLLTECAPSNTSEQCFAWQDECYSWPKSCLDFLPSYSPETCVPPSYGQPTNIITRTTLHHSDCTAIESCDIMKLDISWEPPNMDYHYFPVPSVYYVTLDDETDYLYFKTVNTTNITILQLNQRTLYTVYISAYVPCMGLSGSALGLGLTCGQSGRVSVQPPQTAHTAAHTTTPNVNPTRQIETNIIFYSATLVAGILLVALVSCAAVAVVIILRKRPAKQSGLQHPAKVSDSKIAEDKALPSTKESTYIILHVLS